MIGDSYVEFFACLAYVQFLASGALNCIDDVFTFTVKVLVKVKFFDFPEEEEFWASFAQFICALGCSVRYRDGIEGLVGLGLGVVFVVVVGGGVVVVGVEEASFLDEVVWVAFVVEVLDEVGDSFLVIF